MIYISKRAQGLPLQTIIIFGILIIVAFILIFYFSGRFGFLSRTIGTCESQGGECLYKSGAPGQEATCSEDKPARVITQDCPGIDRKVDSKKGGPCCIPVG
jgi:hypothetical protein